MSITIRQTILEGIRDRNNPIYSKNLGLLKEQLDIESRIETTTSFAHEQKINLDHIIDRLQNNLETVKLNSDPI